MGMPVHLYELEDEYVGSLDMEGSPPDSLDWNGRMFRKSMANSKWGCQCRVQSSGSRSAL